MEIAAGGVQRPGLGDDAVIGAVGPIAGMSGGEPAGGEQSPLLRLDRLAAGDVGGGDLSAIRGEGGRVEELLEVALVFPGSGVLQVVRGPGAVRQPGLDGQCPVERGKENLAPGAGVEPRLGRLVVHFSAGGAVGVRPPELVRAADGGLEVGHGLPAAVQGGHFAGQDRPRDGGRQHPRLAVVGHRGAQLHAVEHRDMGEGGPVPGRDILKRPGRGGAVPGRIHAQRRGAGRAVVVEEAEDDADVARPAFGCLAPGGGVALQIEAQCVRPALVGEHPLGRGQRRCRHRLRRLHLPAQIKRGQVVARPHLDLGPVVAERDRLAAFPARGRTVQCRPAAGLRLEPSDLGRTRAAANLQGQFGRRGDLLGRDHDGGRQSRHGLRTKSLVPAFDLEQHGQGLAPPQIDFPIGLVGGADEKLARRTVDREHLMVGVAGRHERVNVESALRIVDMHASPGLVDHADQAEHGLRHVDRAVHLAGARHDERRPADPPLLVEAALAVGHIPAELLLPAVIGRKAAAAHVDEDLPGRRLPGATPVAVVGRHRLVAATNGGGRARRLGGIDLVGQHLLPIAVDGIAVRVEFLDRQAIEILRRPPRHEQAEIVLAVVAPIAIEAARHLQRTALVGIDLAVAVGVVPGEKSCFGRALFHLADDARRRQEPVAGEQPKVCTLTEALEREIFSAGMVDDLGVGQAGGVDVVPDLFERPCAGCIVDAIAEEGVVGPGQIEMLR